MGVIKWLLKFLRKILVFLLVSSVLAVVAYRFVPVPVTPLMVIRCCEQIKNKKQLKMHHSWTALSNISPHMPVAVIASEDAHFLEHHGFDTKAIQDAVEYNKTHIHKRGASTISQQTAKNVFLWQDRTWVRKGLEAYFTLLIELFWSKQRIMEVYLNSIEMGDGIYGVEAVAQDHFGKSAKELTRAECALIAVSLPNPIKRSSIAPNSRLRKLQRIIERRMKATPPFPMEENDDVNSKRKNK